jgi:hypothetical protein
VIKLGWYRCAQRAQHWRLPSGFNTNVPERECGSTPRSSSAASASEVPVSCEFLHAVAKAPTLLTSISGMENGGNVMRKANTADQSIVEEDLRRQDARFCQRLRKAINSGREVCPTAVSTTPGTQRPILGYQRSDSSQYEFI